MCEWTLAQTMNNDDNGRPSPQRTNCTRDEIDFSVCRVHTIVLAANGMIVAKSRCTIVCRASTRAGRRKQTRSPNQFILFPSILRRILFICFLLLFRFWFSCKRIVAFVSSVFRLYFCLFVRIYNYYYFCSIARDVKLTTAAATPVEVAMVMSMVVMYTSGDHGR